MAKLIVVDRDTVIASHRELEKLLAKDPDWKREEREMERLAEEKNRPHDDEHGRK